MTQERNKLVLIKDSLSVLLPLWGYGWSCYSRKWNDLRSPLQGRTQKENLMSGKIENNAKLTNNTRGIKMYW